MLLYRQHTHQSEAMQTPYEAQADPVCGCGVRNPPTRREGGWEQQNKHNSQCMPHVQSRQRERMGTRVWLMISEARRPLHYAGRKGSAVLPVLAERSSRPARAAAQAQPEARLEG